MPWDSPALKILILSFSLLFFTVSPRLYSLSLPSGTYSHNGAVVGNRVIYIGGRSSTGMNDMVRTFSSSSKSPSRPRQLLSAFFCLFFNGKVVKLTVIFNNIYGRCLPSMRALRQLFQRLNSSVHWLILVSRS